MGGSHPPPPECGYYPYGEPPGAYIGRFQYRDKILRFEFDIGDLVDCIMPAGTENRMMKAVVINKERKRLRSPAGEVGRLEAMYTIRRIDGKVLTLTSGIYPVKVKKDEV